MKKRREKREQFITCLVKKIKVKLSLDDDRLVDY
jgi:hypothetical protein